MNKFDSRTLPTYELERLAQQLRPGAIAGVDEAGRGPWAGPVVAAAVILDADAIPVGIADSKQMTEEAREVVFKRIMETAEVGVGIADVTRIDRDNILAATLWAMSQAVSNLPTAPRLALIDGNKVPHVTCEARAIVKGDARSLSIAAASIIAKVTRDRMMCELAKAHPGYGFERHKGYGTPEHKRGLATHGVTIHHRRSFRPVQLALALAEQDAAASA